MKFINEFVSEKDVSQYRLDEIYSKFWPWDWKDGRPPVFRHAWTKGIDCDVFLILLGRTEKIGKGGRKSPTTDHVFHLGIGNKSLRAVLGRSSRTSDSIHDKPFRKVWTLESIDLSMANGLERDDAIKVLKEALIVYGLAGAHQQVDGTIVEFEF